MAFVYLTRLRSAIGAFSIVSAAGLIPIRADTCDSSSSDECETDTDSPLASELSSNSESAGSSNEVMWTPTTTTHTPATTSSASSSSTEPSSSVGSESGHTSSKDSGSKSVSSYSSSNSAGGLTSTTSGDDEFKSTGSADSTDSALTISTANGLALVGVLLVIWFCIRRNRQNQLNKNPQTYRSLFTPIDINSSDERPTAPAAANGLWTDPAIVVFRIPREKVIMQALVSQGGYGEVYRGSYKDQQVAIKILHPSLRNDIKQINSFLEEARIMASIEHKRLVPFIGVAWDSLRDLCVVTKFMEGGDLRSLLQQFDQDKSRSQGFDADKIKIAMHVAHALAYLHSLRPVVIHRDLKSRNILLDAKWNTKLTDFGVSRETSDQTMTAGVGTTLWMAPEVMMGERYDEKADIFSFGVVLTELDSHQLPYADTKHSKSGRTLPDTAILQKVAMGQVQAEFSVHTPEWLRELGSACLSLEPRDRPIAAQLLYVLQTKC